MTRVFIKWFGEKLPWSDSTLSEFTNYFNASNDIEVVDDESNADAIIVYNKHLTQQRQFEAKLIASTYFRENSDRSYIYDETDNPTFVLPGMYVSTDLNRFGPHVLPVPYLHAKLVNDFAYEAKPKSILCSFWGRESHPIRRHLYGLKGSLYSIANTTNFDFFDQSESNQNQLAQQRRDYINSLQMSQYSLCPRGYGTCSIRLFESMLCHAVPIVISDSYVPPNMFDWNLAAIMIPESEVSNIGVIISHDARKYNERISYIRDVATQSLLTSNVSTSIGKCLPCTNVVQTYKRFLQITTRRLLKRTI